MKSQKLMLSDTFCNILKEMPDNKIKDALLNGEFFVFKDLTDEDFLKHRSDLFEIDFIDISSTDKTKISYLNYNRYKSAVKQEQDVWTIYQSRYSSKPGSLAAKIQAYINKYGGGISVQDVTDFSAQFLHIQSSYKVREVKGESIRYWYHQDNYIKDYDTVLLQSCMKYEACQKLFDIYVNNPTAVKMIIVTDVINGVEKLVARSLVWTSDVKLRFLDKVYYTTDASKQAVMDYANKNNIILNLENTLHYRVPVSIPMDKVATKEYKFPYMDTLCFYSAGYLYNYNDSENVNVIKFKNTCGIYDIAGKSFCAYTHSIGYSIPAITKNDVKFILARFVRDGYFTIDYASYKHKYYLKTECRLSNDNKWIPKEFAVCTEDGWKVGTPAPKAPESAVKPVKSIEESNPETVDLNSESRISNTLSNIFNTTNE